MKEFYFTTYYTENEHDYVSHKLEEECATRGFTLKYYRKFKTGHIPMYRESKVEGNIGAIKGMLQGLEIEHGNYWQGLGVKEQSVK